MADEKPTEPYRPSSGMEGADFQMAWCDRCMRDNFDPEKGADGCSILADALIHDIDDPGYPKEWRCGPEGAFCTAFEARGCEA